MPVSEVNVLADFDLTLNQFYGLVRKNADNLSAGTRLQLQATAIPFDVSNDYPFYSLGNIAGLADMTISPVPVSDLLLTNPLARLSREYYAFLTQLLALIEVKALDAATLATIDKYTTANENMQSHINNLYLKLRTDWSVYADATMTSPGDTVAYVHWLQGRPGMTEIHEVEQEMQRNQAFVEGLRIRKYNDVADQMVVDAYAKFCSPGSRMRYPRFDDRLYKEEQANFTPLYFARLADSESSQFVNLQISRVRSTLSDITSSPLNALDDKITSMSVADSTVTTDWNASGGGGWGPFSFKTSVTNHQVVEDDFKGTQSIQVKTKSLLALQIDLSAWFDPSLFAHPLLAPNRRVFERFLGIRGSLRYLPTHIIVARGFRVEFHSTQEWKHDYKSDMSGGGSGSARIFGFGFGGGGGRSKSVHEQTIETREHALILDDGDNIRLLGYGVTENTAFAQAVETAANDALKLAFN
jgi:hypothetical protein